MKKTIEESKLKAMTVWFNNYMNILEEFVDKYTGDIYLREYGDIYVKVWIQKKYSICWVDFDFWEEFSELFSLEFSDTQSFITRWVEDTYQLKGIDTLRD